MRKFDIVLLTATKYLDKSSGDSLLYNIHEEDRILIDALEKEGLTCCRKAWNDPIFDWSLAAYVLIRTPWDYFERYDEFYNWFEKTARQSKFINSKTLIEWNIDKHYLNDLNQSGVHIPKTLFIEPETKTTLDESVQKAKILKGFQGLDFVLKPSIGGGAWHTYKFHESDTSNLERVFQKLIIGESMMLQEFQVHIIKKGEVSMIIIDGHFTHAVIKKAKAGDFRVQDDFGGSVSIHSPSNEEIDFAEAVVRACPDLPIYARVDIFEDNEGRLALAELEIFEPELWFRLNPKAATTLAERIIEKYF